ncbi:PREDICTED: neurotrypsin-like [Amphimedon queenslandica]|uniref:SRCR domain-containing protein n=1 Tax=Amphimedon queenslandica TaxID=400682 RepID=A0A1X7VNA9_AMPQE|nr:PREDICTED: neurotrypsin-like [Amphimedon queenslandica]|eukprot:XP_011409640.1 PREDICTED: neurotrypsin-like [Amphimedon queenslandica]
MDKTSVICLIFVALLSNVNGQGNGAVRLNNYGNTDATNTRGVVEVYYNSRWGTICITDSSYNHIGDVVCHQLGFNGGSSGSVSHNSLNTKAVITNVRCKKDMLVILQCEHGTSVSSCGPSDNVEVNCNTARLWDNPYNGMVRLQGGYYSGQGVVEIYCKESWEAVCNDDQLFKSEAADVVCTQLGYNGHQIYIDSILHDDTTWLHNVDCKSESSSKCLFDCGGGSCPDSFFRCTRYGVNVTCEYNTQISDKGGYINTCKNSGLSGGAIAGIVLGVTVTFVALCACCCCMLWKIKRSKKEDQKELLENKAKNDK